jgi:hypothetical protein
MQKRDTFPKKRSPSTATSDLREVSIYRGRITNVNIRDYTADTRMEASPYTNKFDIPWISPYVNQNQGEGINWMPEVGSVCWVCEPSEDGRESFILGWMVVDEGGSYRGGRSLLNPGDIELKTRDLNFVTLRRGGIVQIGSTPVCQRIFLPIRNIMQDFAENYEMHTPAGDLTWQVMRQDEDSDGHQKCLYQLAAKQYADDPNDGPVALLKIGSHGDGDDTILTLQTRDKGGGDVKITLTLDTDGNVVWTMEKDYSLTLNSGDYTVQVKGGKVTISSNKAMSFDSQDTFDQHSTKAMGIKTDDAMTLQAMQKLALKGTAGIDIDVALFPVMRASPDFIAWMNAVTAQLAAGAPPTFGGVAPNPGITALLPKNYQNPKVNV